MAFYKVSEKVVRPRELCFTQDSIRVTFKSPRDQDRIDDAVDLIVQGKLSPKAFPKMNVVEFQDRLWSLDNRRLWVFKKAEVNFITVTLVAYPFGKRLHSLVSTSPYLYYTMSKPDFLPRIRGYCKEIFTEEDPDLPSSPPLPPTPNVRVRPPEMPTKIYKHSRPSSALFSVPKPDTPPKRPRSSPPKVAKVSKHLDYDHHLRRHHLAVASPFKSQNSDAPSIPRMRGLDLPPPSKKNSSPGYGSSLPQDNRRPYETEHHHSRTHYEACSPPPAKKSRAPSHQVRDFNASSPAPSWRPYEECSSPPLAKAPRAPSHQARELRTSPAPPNSPVPMTPRQRPTAPRPPRKEVQAPSPPRMAKASQPVMKSQTVTRSSSEKKADRPGNLPSRRTIEPKVLRSDRQPSREEHSDKRPPLPLLSKDKNPQRGREASPTCRAVRKPPSPSAPKRRKTPSSPPNFSYGFHSCTRKRPRPSKAPKKTAASTPSTKSSSTPSNDPVLPSSASPSCGRFTRATSEAASKMPPPSLSKTASPSATTKKRERDDNFTSDLPIPSVPGPKFPPIPSKKKSDHEYHASSSCPHASENHDHHSNFGPSPTTKTRPESPRLVESEIMTETEINLFKLDKQEPAVDPELPLSLTPCKEFTPQDRQALDSIVELFLRDAKSPLQAGQTKLIVNARKESSEAVFSPHQLPSRMPIDEVCVKRPQNVPQDTSVEVDVPTFVIECPVQYDSKGQLFESTLKVLGTLNNPSTTSYGDGDVHRATGNVDVTVTVGLESPEPKASTPVSGREVQEIQSEPKGNATTDHQQGIKELSRGSGFLEMARTARNEVSVRLAKTIQALPIPENEGLQQASQRITRSQSKKQKEMERRKAREKRKEKEREAESLLRKKSQSAPKNVTTEIVPYDPERSKEALPGVRTVQAGDMVYVKVNAEFTGIGSGGLKKGPKSKVRLHPYLRIIGPFKVERKFNGHAAVLEFPDDCDLRPIVGMRALLKSRKPLHRNYLHEHRLSVKLEPQTILNKRVARRLKKRKVLHYLVKWKTLPATEATWEPETIFDEHPHLLDHINSPLFANPYLLRNWRA